MKGFTVLEALVASNHIKDRIILIHPLDVPTVLLDTIGHDIQIIVNENNPREKCSVMSKENYEIIKRGINGKG